MPMLMIMYFIFNLYSVRQENFYGLVRADWSFFQRIYSAVYFFYWNSQAPL